MKKGTLILRSRLKLLKPFIAGCSLSTARVWQDRVGKLMSAVNRSDVTFDDFTIGSMPACTVKPRDEVSSGIILYLHGGGYTCGDLDYAKGCAATLAARCGVRQALLTDLRPSSPSPPPLTTPRTLTAICSRQGTRPGRSCCAVRARAADFATRFACAIRQRGAPCPQALLPFPPGST